MCQDALQRTTCDVIHTSALRKGRRTVFFLPALSTEATIGLDAPRRWSKFSTALRSCKAAFLCLCYVGLPYFTAADAAIVAAHTTEPVCPVGGRCQPTKRSVAGSSTALIIFLARPAFYPPSSGLPFCTFSSFPPPTSQLQLTARCHPPVLPPARLHHRPGGQAGPHWRRGGRRS